MTEKKLIKSPLKIPIFKQYYPSYSDLDKNQRTFYNLLRTALKNGHYIDVEGNISYLFIYIYNLICRLYKSDPDNLYYKLLNLSEIYSHEKNVSSYCLLWAYDTLLFQKKYDEYLNVSEPVYNLEKVKHSDMFNARIGLKRFLGIELNAADFLHCYRRNFFKYIRGNADLFKLEINNAYQEYLQRSTCIIDQCMKNMSVTYDYPLFINVPCFDQLNNILFTYHNPFLCEGLVEELKHIYLQAENSTRAFIGLPKIGEGWISETNLYYDLKEWFSDTVVCQHGRPSWLQQQHFDIWFPRWNVAVEYHGKQHFEPVDYFGGEDALKQNQERDTRKECLAKKHDVKLIIVREGYDFKDLVEIIESHINKDKLHFKV